MSFKFKTIIALASLCTLGNFCDGQQNYSVMPLNESFDLEKIKAEPEANDDEKRAASILRQRISKQQQNASEVYRTGNMNSQFANYYNQVIIPSLTRYDRQSLAELTSKHQQIIKDLATRVRAQNVFVYLVKDVLFPKLSEIVDGGYHPAVRYNAILTIGKLDEVVGRQRVAPPKPFRQSLAYLIAKYNEFNDPKLAYLKYGAYKGIARIAGIEFQKSDSTAEAAKPIFTALLGAAPAGLDRDLFLAMQKTAVVTLGVLGDPANADAFENLIKDQNVPIWTRAEAVAAYAKIKAPTMDAAKLGAVADSSAKFMHDVLRQEVKFMDAVQQRMAVLAARKKEVSLDGPRNSFSAGSAPGSGGASGAGGAGDIFSGENPNSAGGNSAGANTRGGSNSGGAPSSGPSSGPGGPPKKKSAGAELTELPAYRIEMTRRRIKTVALNLIEAFGEFSEDRKTGMLRWSNGNQNLFNKLKNLKALIVEADAASEVGLSEEGVSTSEVTDLIRSELSTVADKIASALGAKPSPVNQPGKNGPAKGKKKAAKKKAAKKQSGFDAIDGQ